MSQENIRSVSDALAVFNRGDVDAYLEYWTDDIEWRAAEGAIDNHGPIHGKAELRAYMQDWLGTFDQVKVEPLEVIDAGEDQVVAVLRISGRAKLSGVEVDLTFAAVYTVRDEKIARGREYWTKHQAFEAAGIEE